MRIFLTIVFSLLALIAYKLNTCVNNDSFWVEILKNLPYVDNKTRNTLRNIYLVIAFIFLALAIIICFSVI